MELFPVMRRCAVGFPAPCQSSAGTKVPARIQWIVAYPPRRTLVDLERLSRAEQRSAALWAELRDVEAKQTELQTRSDEVTYALKPENIERAVAGYGSTKPEEVREERRRQLENEKTRIEKQLAQLAANHTRLEQAIASADAEAETLRKRLDAVDKAALENAKTKAQGEGAAPAATPSPSPNQ